MREVTIIKPSQEVFDYVKFLKNMDNYSVWANVSDNQTKVMWGFTGKMPYPMNLMLLCMNMDKMLGKDLETGLNNLKSTLEK